MANGSYSAWDCLNSWYQVDTVETLESFNLVIVTFKGIYNMDMVAQQYRSLPGVRYAEESKYAEADGLFGRRGDNIRATILEGDTWQFVFTRDDEEFFHLTTTSDGVRVYGGRFYREHVYSGKY